MLTRPLRPVLAVVALTALALSLTLVAAPTASEAKLRTCGTIDFSGVRTQIVVLRHVRCRTARRVARAYERGTPPRPWRCGLARAGDPDRVGFSCGRGARGGDIRKFPRAFVGRVPRS